MTTSIDTHQNHHHADDLLDGYLLGTLSPADAAWMETHVRECPHCRQEMAPLMTAVQALPFSAPKPDVPMSADLWDRIERSVSARSAPNREEADIIPLSSQQPTPLRPEPASRRWGAREWLAIAAVALVSLLGGTVLGQTLPQFGEDGGQDQQVIAIQFTDPGVTASGELRYLPDEQVFVLEVTGMPELPEGQVYQAWLIDDSAPVPVGVIDPASGEIATTGDRDAYQTFAITVEQGPLGNPAPTSAPIMVAALQDTDAS